MSSIHITERFLMDTGGWPAVKHAKALVQMGRVVSFNYTPPILRGLVREGETEYRAGLKILSYTDVENICSCRESREWGKICVHSLALGLASIRPETVLAKQAEAPAPAVRLPLLMAQPDLGAGNLDSGSRTGAKEGQAERIGIELHVVLPPNLEPGWEKNQIVVGFEAARKGNRTLASALDPKLIYTCSKIDKEVLELGRDLTGGKLPGMLILDRDNLLRLIGTLVGHPRVTLARKTSIVISDERLLPRLATEVLPDGRWKISTDTSKLAGVWFVGSSSAWLWSDLRLRPVSPGLPAAYLPVLRAPINLSTEQGLNFVQRELPTLSSYFQFDATAQTSLSVEPALPEVIAVFEGSLNQLGAKVQCRYGQRMVTLGVTSQAETFVYREGDAMRSRNLPFERASLRRILDAGFTGPSTAGEYLLRGQNSILSFFARDLPKLQKEWKVSIGSRFQYVTRSVERIVPKLQIIGSGEDWFDFSFSVESGGGQQFSTVEVQRLLQMGQSVTRLRDGRLAILDR